MLKGSRTKADLAWGGPFGNRNFLLPGMTPASPRRLAPRQTSRGGVSLLEIKFLFTKADAGVIKGYRTKADLAWGGSHLEKKIPLHQGSPRRDQGIRTKADLAWGGGLLENKNFLLPGLTPA